MAKQTGNTWFGLSNPLMKFEEWLTIKSVNPLDKLMTLMSGFSSLYVGTVG